MNHISSKFPKAKSSKGGAPQARKFDFHISYHPVPAEIAEQENAAAIAPVANPIAEPVPAPPLTPRERMRATLRVAEAELAAAESAAQQSTPRAPIQLPGQLTFVSKFLDQAFTHSKQALTLQFWSGHWEALGPNRWRAITALAVAICVVLFSAPSWEPEDDAALLNTYSLEEKGGGLPMPFERAGISWPGSAFYYIEESTKLSSDYLEKETMLFDISGTGDMGAVEKVMEKRAGPAASAFKFDMSANDQASALECMTKAVYYEAASESIGGQRAVAQVILNRVAHPSYPNNVCGVVFQGSQRRTGCQFSFTCDGSLKRKPSAAAWARARAVARDALSGLVYKPVGLATHYHTVWIYPYWAPSLDPVGTIGAHRFYKWRGAAGRSNAFIARYRGGERIPTPNLGSPKRNEAAEDEADPLALARAFEEARKKAEKEAKAAAAEQEARRPFNAPKPPASRVEHAAPVYSAEVERMGGDAIFKADALPESGGVKAEYANSGRWLRDPGQR